MKGGLYLDKDPCQTFLPDFLSTLTVFVLIVRDRKRGIEKAHRDTLFTGQQFREQLLSTLVKGCAYL